MIIQKRPDTGVQTKEDRWLKVGGRAWDWGPGFKARVCLEALFALRSVPALWQERKTEPGDS